MAIILNNKKSTYSSPYAYYTVEVTETSNRTATTVDITFKITSNLAYSSSSLGRGYTLNANLYLNGNWSENITLKASSDSWSGTTKHYKTQSITVSGLGSSDTELSNVQFRVVSSASDNAAGLNATACSNIEIPTGHTPPVISSYSIAEVNSDLSGVSNDLIVENLSIKRFTVNYTLYDNATISTVGIYNSIYSYSTTNFTITSPETLTFDLDCSQINFVKSDTDNTKIPIVVRVIDSEDTQGTLPSPYTPNLYNYVPYVLPYIEQANTTAVRDGQTSGKVKLNVNGTYYNQGTISQSLNVYYKFWEAGASEPEDSSYIQVTSSLTTGTNTFKVTDLQIGNETEGASNWFDPEKAYRVRVKVADRYNTYIMTEPMSIPVGESIWDEYKDHVDFKKLTIKGIEIDPVTYSGDITSSFSKISGNGNIISATYVKYQKIVNLIITFDTSGGSTSAGSNIWEGTLDVSNLLPVGAETHGVGYYGDVHCIANLTNTGEMTIRALGGTFNATTNAHGLYISYISV